MLVSLILFLLPFAFAAEEFHVATLPHYVLHVQQGRVPANLDIQLESIHTRLAFDLSMFSPWMLKDRVNLYLYKDQKSYAEGEFKPSPWSIGYSIYADKVLLLYRQEDRKVMLGIIAHESTHIYFESYWAEKGAQPPAWINEGLATLEESDTRMHPQDSYRFRDMAHLPDHEIPLEKFFSTTPATDLKKAEDKPEVLLWYSQAFSITYFLLRKHTGRQFKDFCDRLRDLQDVEQALKGAYGYADLGAFERDWEKWLTGPAFQKKLSGFGAAASAPSLDSDESGRNNIHGLKDGFSTRVK